jgi:hypothetical protein
MGIIDAGAFRLAQVPTVPALTLALRFKGQSQHFRDELHPLPLPGSYLYGNMLLHELKMATAGQETAVPGPKARKKRR